MVKATEVHTFVSKAIMRDECYHHILCAIAAWLWVWLQWLFQRSRELQTKVWQCVVWFIQKQAFPGKVPSWRKHGPFPLKSCLLSLWFVYCMPIFVQSWSQTIVDKSLLSKDYKEKLWKAKLSTPFYAVREAPYFFLSPLFPEHPPQQDTLLFKKWPSTITSGGPASCRGFKMFFLQ